MITVACSVNEIHQGLEICRKHNQVRVAAGIHPHQALRASQDDLKELAELWRKPQIVAAGEIGLDFHYDYSPRDVQQTIFEQQLELAGKAELPVIIHSRNAHHLVVRTLSKHGYADKPVVFHCFSGTPDEAAELRTNGWRTSFTGIITFKNAEPQQQACIDTPIDQIMFETDAPYLSPEPVRHLRPNEPKNLIHTVRFAAELRGQTFESLARTATANAVEFFGL
jgi:TatD DNase family protein